MRLAEADDEMRHQAVVVGAVPVSRAGRRPHYIASFQTLRNSTLVADSAGSVEYLQHLSLLVGMPVGASARGKGYVGDGGHRIAMDGIEIDVSIESARHLLGTAALRSTKDERFGHLETLVGK